jgi:hypothetical protein
MEKNIMNSLVSLGYTSGLINIIDDLSIDSSTVASKKGGKKKIGFDGHKRTKGSKIHVAVTLRSFFTNSNGFGTRKRA